MPSLIDATVNGPNSNSYATLAEAETYFATRMGIAAWTALANDPNKEITLITATNLLEQQRYQGAKATPGQRLKWGRSGVVDEDGVPVLPTVMPWQMKAAEFELALHLAANPTAEALVPTGLEPFKALKAGTVDLTMADRTPVEKSGLPPAVIRLLGLWLITYDTAGADIMPGTFKVVRA